MGKRNEPESFPIWEGNIVLYTRLVRGKLSPVWQAKITTASGKGRLRISTKTKSFNEAKRKAINFYKQADARVQTGLPLNSVRWETATRRYIEWMQKRVEMGRCSLATYDSHKTIISQCLNEAFKGKLLHEIKSSDIEDYQLSRRNMGAKRDKNVRVSAHTINLDYAVIRGIFKHAMRDNLVDKMPLIERLKNDKNHRPSFTSEEAERLKTALDEWADSAHHADGGHVKDYRILFRLYCLTIYYSGIRPGKEMASLRWADVEYVNNEYVLLLAETSKQKSGEYKQRKVVALSYLKEHLEEVKSFSHLYNSNGYIFAHPITTQLDKSYVGKPIASFKAQWNTFIDWAGLEYELTSRGQRRTLYSLRHLYFEQRLINSDVGLYELAKNGGTSVQVIQDWYAHVTSDKFATKLSRVIDRNNPQS